jgi:DtxR family Mn-dependent transcriptional regulator
MEDYLKAIYLLSGDNKRVSTNGLAERMKCSPASVTNMLRKLSALKLVDYTRYQGVLLTEPGSKVALEVLRHHRLLELYLNEVLGYTWDQVHQEAEELEHVISEEFEARIDKALGYPTHDPHGHPIPSKDGHLPSQSRRTLWDAEVGEEVRVRLVSDRDPAVLRQLATFGIFPEALVRIVGRKGKKGRLIVEVSQIEIQISRRLASHVFVSQA